MFTLFWFCAALVFYTYVGYPCIIWALAKIAPAAQIQLPQSNNTHVSICVAVHNERNRIENKLANLSSLDFPRDHTEWVFASDGSTDGTNDLLSGKPNLVLVECPRLGKAAAINAAAQRATGEILVFTDARQELARDSVGHLVSALSDRGVGAVSGELVHRDGSTGASASIGLYWRYEKFIRIHESAFFSCVGATGALYALRRTDFEPMRVGTILDDFEVPMAVVRGGRRILLETRAKVIDDLETDLAGEHRRKVRTLTGNFQSFANNGWLFSPRQNPAWWQFLSHKVARLVVPYALGGAFVASWLLPDPIYTVLALAQTAFYALGVAALASKTIRQSRVASVAGLFVDTNLAAVEAAWRFVSRDMRNLWIHESSG